LKNRSLAAQFFSGLLLTVVTLAFVGCGQNLYPLPANNFANRPIPPSQLLQRVMAGFTSNGSSGGLEILDANRDLRSNVQNTIPSFSISGFASGSPSTIISYPEESLGYVFSSTDGSFTAINYGKEASGGSVATFAATSPSVAAATDGSRFLGAQEVNGQLAISGGGSSFFLNLPNVDKVVVNRGNTVIFAMVRNSDLLYRVIKVNASSNPSFPPGSVDCQPLLLPVYCVVPVAVPGQPKAFDRPSDVYFSLDGTTAYVMNCGPECGGTTAGLTLLQTGALTVDVIPTVNPLSPTAPSPLSVLPVPNPIPIPGGVTVAVSDGSTLYLAGQQLLADGLFTGNLTTLNLATFTVTGKSSISDGHHSKILFADDNTLWIGAQQCANGERNKQSSLGVTTQAANVNCLTAVKLGTSPLVPQIVPAAVAGTSTTVGFPNTNQNQFYYGSLTGLCWVQEFHKMYTAYGGQIHAFYTGGTITSKFDPAVGTTPALGTEIDNTNITIQGTVLDVAYMDALTNDAN
jgi:hypothetical protein